MADDDPEKRSASSPAQPPAGSAGSGTNAAQAAIQIFQRLAEYNKATAANTVQRSPPTPREQPEKELSGEVAGAGANTPKNRKRKPPQASSLPVVGGRREMKAYAVTEDELENLGLLSLSTTVSFSLASFLAAFWLSVRTSIALSSDVKSEVISYWEGLSTGAAVAAAVLALIGGFLMWRSNTKIGHIKKGTEHG